MLAERANGGAWTVNGFGACLYQRGSDYLHWSLRGDLAGINASSANVPITNTFCDTVSGMRQVHDWNGAWLYRSELTESGGLVKVDVRWYDPAIGRFLQQDPWLRLLYIPRTLNAYSYCVNDPIQLFDPRGEWFDTVLDFVGSIYDISKRDWVGAIIGIVRLLIPCIPSSAIETIREALENAPELDKIIKGGAKYRGKSGGKLEFTSAGYTFKVRIDEPDPNAQDDLHRKGHLDVEIWKDGQRKGKERIPLPPGIL